MIAALPILSGIQLILSALNFDIRNVPKLPKAFAMGSEFECGGHAAWAPMHPVRGHER
jgi:hypothetical protein